MQFFHNTNLNFVGYRKIFFLITMTINIIGLIYIFIVPFFNVTVIEYGIDFLGGSEIALKLDKPLSTNEVRHAVDKTSFKAEEVKSFGKDNQYIIRIKESGKAAENFETQIKAQLKDAGLTILKKDTIGPKIGGEMRTQALIAVILAILAILTYVAFRFEFTFGLGAIIALIHDVIFTFTIIVLFHKLRIINLEVNSSILAAMLTVIGYSVNDTVIIFDRVRENREKHKGMNFIKMLNLSVNETLSRTVNTVMTVVLVLITMVAFAGPVLQGFAFTMLVGVLIGTYSSVYIAGAYVIWFMERVKKTVVDEDAKGAVTAAPIKA